VFPEGWQRTGEKEWTHSDGAKVTENPGKPEGVISIANALPDMGAMTKFDISSNNLRAEGGKSLAEGLKGNQVIKELNFRGNDLGRNSKYDTDTSGIIAIADVIPGMEALSVTNVMGNKIGKEQLAKLQEVMHSKPNLVSLCGIADDATEADLSGLGMDADDAAILASELPDKGALSVLSLKSNNLRADGGKALAEGLKGNTVITELDISTNALGVDSGYKPDMSGVIALANAIKDTGALTKLDISDNNIEQGEALQRIADLCHTKGVELDNHKSESESESESDS
jgi:Ran GTPase-activating protein (RanGAP) involved in mRNA processing and transport